MNNGFKPLHEEIVVFGLQDKNKSYFLSNPDEWAERVISNWNLSKNIIAPNAIESSKVIETESHNDSSELKEHLVNDLKEFLSSYCPRLKSEELYLKVLKIIESISKIQDIESLKDSI